MKYAPCLQLLRLSNAYGFNVANPFVVNRPLVFTLGPSSVREGGLVSPIYKIFLPEMRFCSYETYIRRKIS